MKGVNRMMVSRLMMVWKDARLISGSAMPNVPVMRSNSCLMKIKESRVVTMLK